MKTMLAKLFRALSATALTLALPGLAQAPPPEARELQAALALQDPAAKVKELERLQAAYPASPLKPVLEGQLRSIRISLAATLDEVLTLQQADLRGATGAQRVTGPGVAARQLLEHPKVASFDKAKVLAVVQGYRDQARQAAADPAVLAATEERTREYLPAMAGDVDIFLARAQALAGDAPKALGTLNAFVKAEGIPSGAYFLARAVVLEALGRPKEAEAALLDAALENHPEGLRRAKEAFLKRTGKEEGFEAVLDAKRKELPFHPAPVKAGPAWKGKAVLAELFTGSECPPCVAADLAFDGLLESHAPTTLVVLEYHLPIPGPDPMMNPATRKRQEYYGVNSTPTMFFDGQDKLTGGGGRARSEAKYKQAAAVVAKRGETAPGASLQLKTLRKADLVEATFSLGKAIAGVDYHLVLVQPQQEHKGGNKVLVHKMVVRDLLTLDPAATSASFDLAASEKAADAHLTELEKANPRFKGFQFPVRRSAISREGLKVALFAQERATRQVLQVVLAEVK